MISNRDERFIDMAANEALRSKCLMRHGCVAVINGRIVGRGCNNYRCHSSDGFINNTMTCHAEIAAIRNASKQNIKFNKIVLYVVRVDANNSLKLSAPCIDCMEKINALNIKRIVHSTNKGTLITQKPKNIINNHITTGRRRLINV